MESKLSNEFVLSEIFQSSYETKNKFYEVAELFVIILGSFLIPFVLGHPQLLVGTLVNSLLIISAVRIKDYKIIFPIILPSIAALSRALLFGPFTKYLLFMLPFIWLGNLLLVIFIKLIGLYLEKGIIAAGSFGSAVKAGFLFSSAFLLFKTGLVPKAFLTAFGITQFATALAGLAVAYPIVKITSTRRRFVKGHARR
ncbi:MAG: hypothetical protein QXW00_03440 [Candidatus Woesearchaeota archaeon]